MSIDRAAHAEWRLLRVAERGEAAYESVNERAAKAGLTELVDRLRSMDLRATLFALDQWWSTDHPTKEQQRIMLLTIWGGVMNPNLHNEIDKWVGRFREVGFVSEFIDEMRPDRDLVVFRARRKDGSMEWRGPPQPK